MWVGVLLCFVLGQSLLCNAWLFNRERCFSEMRREFACYSIRRPYTNTLFHLPRSPSQQEIRFELFTPRNRASPQLLRAMDASSVQHSNFNESGKVAVLIHGFTDSSRKQWVVDLKDKLLDVLPNVIAVDWEEGAKLPNYPRAVANTRVVGAQLATLIASLGVDPPDVHIIGHSLGAHVAGYAGEKFGPGSPFHGPKIGRITGLDPAGPLFEKFHDRVKLDPSDAAFVDVIHTDAPLIAGGLGVKRRAGHVDFYPNGGSRMPGCRHKIFSFLDLENIRDTLPCSHNRAPEYFIASVEDNTFTAYQCRNKVWWRFCDSCDDGCNRMGYHATPYPSGLFTLATGSSYPF